MPLPGLKAVRVGRRLTVEGLAQRTGLHRDTVNRLENLRRGADPVTLGVLAGTLGVSEAELTGEEPGA